MLTSFHAPLRERPFFDISTTSGLARIAANFALRSDANFGANIETLPRFTHATIPNNTRILKRRIARSIEFFSASGVESVPKWSNFVSKNRVAQFENAESSNSVFA